MRVAQLVETLGAGGAQRLAVGIAETLSIRGHESLVVALSAEGPLREIMPTGVELHDLGFARGGGGSVGDLLALPGAYLRLESLLKRRGVEVLQTHLPGANYCGLLLARRGICRVYPTVHNTREFEYGNTRNRWRGRWRRRAYRGMLDRCAAMIAVSTGVRDAMLEELGLTAVPPDRFHVVPNAVRVPGPLTDNESAAVRADLAIPQDAILVLAIGRMTEQKNFGDLLNVLAALDSSVPDWRCLIAGDGPLYGDLVQAVAAKGLSGKVLLPGQVSGIERMLGTADIFCMPSLWEGRPLALLEAMAAGLPVVAYGIEGVAELVEDGVVGYLCEPGDVASFGRALNGLLANPAQARRMGAAGRTVIEDHHDWEAMVDRLENIYGA